MCYIFLVHHRCLPDYVENFISEGGPFGELTTFELLCGSDNTTNISPIKFTGLSNKSKTGINRFIVVYSLVWYRNSLSPCGVNVSG